MFLSSLPPRGELGAPQEFLGTVSAFSTDIVSQHIPSCQQSIRFPQIYPGIPLWRRKGCTDQNSHTLSLSQKVRRRRSSASKLKRLEHRTTHRARRRRCFRAWQSDLKGQHFTETHKDGRIRDSSYPSFSSDQSPNACTLHSQVSHYGSHPPSILPSTTNGTLPPGLPHPTITTHCPQATSPHTTPAPPLATPPKPSRKQPLHSHQPKTLATGHSSRQAQRSLQDQGQAHHRRGFTIQAQSLS